MKPALLFIVMQVSALAAFAVAAEPVDFHRDVLPILQRECFECHGARKQEAELRLDRREFALRDPAILAKGNAAASELVRRISLPAGDDEVMPNRGEPLTQAEVATLRAWIDAGAEWPENLPTTPHWAYQVPERAPPPALDAADEQFGNAIDAWVLAQLRQAGMSFSPPADKAVLIRRVSLDLIGLPPTPAEVDAFVRDDSPGAYARLVDRLLASPQFGVRWARPWLDYARYADSHGFQRDDFRDLWPYRDWVVNALNEDMPFTQFTIEQLAGDLLPNASESQRIATGFNRSAPTNVEAGSDPEETRVNQVHDRVNTLGMVWLGTTLECAQCHDHKYDPFTLRDYYGLFAFFNNTAREADRTNPKVPGSIQFQGPTMPLTAAMTKNPATTLVMREDTPRTTFLFLRGDFRSPGEAVPAAIPAALSSPSIDADRTANDTPDRRAIPGQPTRLDLARWLVSRENPLVARVVVNRWWAELFGHGLVGTPEDFGIKGERPTHPELLDWLACEFMDNGWSQKKLLRTLVMSATYQQASRITPELLARDDRNRLYARGPRQRLEAELIRDNALAIAGLLHPRLGGPPIKPFQPDGLWIKVGGQKYEYEISPGDEKYRRGLYVVWKRSAPYPSFVSFDANNRMACRVSRPRSNTPLQALALMNDPVYVEVAMGFASRMLTEQPHTNDSGRIRHAYRVAVSREARAEEIAILLELLQAERAARGANAKAAQVFVGKFPLPEGVSCVEFAAWYAVAATILNLDEVISKG